MSRRRIGQEKFGIPKKVVAKHFTTPKFVGDADKRGMRLAKPRFACMMTFWSLP